MASVTKLLSVRTFSSATESNKGKVGSNEDGGKGEGKPEEQPKSRIRQYFDMYGAVGIGIYGAVYIGTLSGIFVLVESNIIGAGDAIGVLKSTGLDAWFDTSLIKPKQGNFAVAWILTKFTEPLRLGISVAITPAIARLIGRAPSRSK